MQQRRRFSILNVPKNRGRIGGLIVMVDSGPRSPDNPDGIWVSGNVTLPEEIIEAARNWYKMREYADMDLSEYLNRMFDAEEYSRELL